MLFRAERSARLAPNGHRKERLVVPPGGCLLYTSRWSAGGILLACLFFGFCDALQIKLQVSGIAIPYQFFQMIPYLATVLVLSLIGAKQTGPRANGQPYRREQR